MPFVTPSPDDPNWEPEDGAWGFHCGFTLVREARKPSPCNPRGECAYDGDTLVDDNHPLSACKGTPDSYGVDTLMDSWNHTVNDPGGPAANWDAFETSMAVHYDNWVNTPSPTISPFVP